MAKKHGIRANMKSVDIVTALKDLYESEQQRLNAEHEAAALAASGLPTATADISVITEASFVDVPASPSAGSAANDSDDDDAASTGDICAAVERAEGTATAAEPIASPAQQPVAVEAAAAPMQAAPASTKKARGSARRPVSAASQRRKSRGSAAAATKNTRAAATFKAASKVKAPEDRPTKLAMPKKRVTKNWDQIHSKLFANQVLPNMRAGVTRNHATPNFPHVAGIYFPAHEPPQDAQAKVDASENLHQRQEGHTKVSCGDAASQDTRGGARVEEEALRAREIQ